MHAAYDDHTIIAQCTPSGSGALALLRLSGINARRIVSSISVLSAGKTIETVPTHTIHYGSIIDHEKKVLDHVLFLIMDAPHSFTGEHTVEITCHNNPFLIESIIDQAVKNGARLARPGEFTERAFMNDKIDLVQAEAINELIHANTQFALKKSLEQLSGSFSHWIAQLEQSLLKTLAWSEASFEFLDDEQEFADRIRQHLHEIIAHILTLQKNFDKQATIRQGIRIALIGSVNAGKSSLFNRLVGQQRAIVTPIAGTTRDSIETGLYRHSTYWTVVDTAGLRQTDDIIEQEGIQRSYQEAHKADIILLVIDSSRPTSPSEELIYQDLVKNFDHKIVRIYHKADMQRAFFDNKGMLISSLTGHGINELEKVIKQKIETMLDEYQSPFLLNKRHHDLLASVHRELQKIEELLTHEMISYELISYHLRDALAQLSQLTGKSISEAGMDAVFRQFCVGK